MALSLVQPFEYRTDVRLLIIQKQSSGYDPYLSMKAADRIAQAFAEVILTSSFIQRVKESDFSIPEEFFAMDEIRAKQQWKHHVKVKTRPSSGLLEIQAYHKERDLSLKLASAIADVIVNQGSEYHGGGEDIVIKVVDAPVATKKPARPDIFFNVAVGAVVGILLSAIFLFLSAQDEDSLEQSLVGRDRDFQSSQQTSSFDTSVGMSSLHPAQQAPDTQVRQGKPQEREWISQQFSERKNLQESRVQGQSDPLLPIEEENTDEAV